VLAAFALLTVGTGMVDAVSSVALGHVFVVNLMGDLAFFAFALTGVGLLPASA